VLALFFWYKRLYSKKYRKCYKNYILKNGIVGYNCIKKFGDYMEFKLDLPYQCPPQNTTPVNLAPVYRLIDGENISYSDLLSHVEVGLNFPPNQECQAHAVSLYQDIKSIEELQKKYKKLRSKKIYEGQITKKCGVVDLYLNKSHINLWVFKDIDLLKIFQRG